PAVPLPLVIPSLSISPVFPASPPTIFDLKIQPRPDMRRFSPPLTSKLSAKPLLSIALQFPTHPREFRIAPPPRFCSGLEYWPWKRPDGSCDFRAIELPEGLKKP